MIIVHNTRIRKNTDFENRTIEIDVETLVKKFLIQMLIISYMAAKIITIYKRS